VHEGVDKPGATARRSRTSREGAGEAEERPFRARSVWLTSERLGVSAKIDIVEGEGGPEGGHAIPIEYKRGSPPDVLEGAYLPERVQICTHALLLREHGYTCDAGAIYYAGARRRVSIAIDDALIRATLRSDAMQRQRIPLMNTILFAARHESCQPRREASLARDARPARGCVSASRARRQRANARGSSTMT
jgi:CRISPR-associated protein Cas1